MEATLIFGNEGVVFGVWGLGFREAVLTHMFQSEPFSPIVHAVENCTPSVEFRSQE